MLQWAKRKCCSSRAARDEEYHGGLFPDEPSHGLVPAPAVREVKQQVVRAQQADGHGTVAAYTDHRRATVDLPVVYIRNGTSMKVQDHRVFGGCSWYRVEQGWVKSRNVVDITAQVEEEAELSAVILTVRGGSNSYDELFTKVPQIGPNGSRVAVYQLTYADLPAVLRALRNPPHQRRAGSGGGCGPHQEQQHHKLRQEVHSVNPEEFVLNLECCGCCSDGGFQVSETQSLWEMIEWCIGRGSFVMASDFSLKALIQDWRTEVLGPNPFMRGLGGGTRGSGREVGRFGGHASSCDRSFRLRFDPVALAACPSAQLQTVGELCPQGSAGVSAQGGTIVYTVSPAGRAAAEAAGATLEVLTVADVVDGVRLTAAQLGERGTALSSAQRGGSASSGSAAVAAGDGDAAVRGLAGHVLLTLPSGGKLLTSMGHWMELSQLGVTEEALFAACSRRGARYESAVRAELDSCGGDLRRRSAVMERRGRELVRSSAPCSASRSRV